MLPYILYTASVEYILRTFFLYTMFFMMLERSVTSVHTHRLHLCMRVASGCLYIYPLPGY